MAQVARDPQLAARIDDYLDYLLRKWAGLPALAREWDTWDAHSQFSWAMDWGVPADRLAQLQHWAAQDALTPEQKGRYEQLQALVTQHRGTLRRLLGEPVEDLA